MLKIAIINSLNKRYKRTNLWLILQQNLKSAKNVLLV